MRLNVNILSVLTLASAIFLSPFIPRIANAQSVLHLEGFSDQKTFKLKIDWTTADIGRENAFNVSFYDSDTGTLIEDVVYDFLVYDGSGQSVVERVAVHNTTQTVMFQGDGGYVIRIRNIEGLGEAISIPIQVTPEFPSVAGFLPAQLIAAVIAGRLAIIYLDRRFE